jgi:hypothetical protein
MDKLPLFQLFAVLLTVPVLLPAQPAVAVIDATRRIETTEGTTPVLWREPADIRTRNLLYGTGGREDAPHGKTFVFIKEDMDGTNPKFVVRDGDGVKWKIKVGPEAKPETAATRLVWAVGYFTDEDYFVQDIQITDFPKHVHRGKQFVSAGGTLHGVRFEREDNGQAKDSNWKWRNDPFVHTREWNGLRTLMAVINDWDLKDMNNSIYVRKATSSGGTREQDYVISDLGASFGTVNLVWPRHPSRGNLNAYSRSKFITKTNELGVDFAVPGTPSIANIFDVPAYIGRMRMRWIGKNLPRSDARWMGEMLAKLSPAQIRDAFRAAGYSDAEVEGFARVVEQRIVLLNDL